MPKRLIAVLSVLFVLILGLSVGISSVSAESIVIHDRGSGSAPPSAATPYPSTYTVSGFLGNIVDVDVVLVGFTHPRGDDIDMLLVGPQGQQIWLMSDACGITIPINNATITFNDQTANDIPNVNSCTTGSYRPMNYNPGDPDTLPSFTPSISGTTLSVFNGTDPNGVWQLYIADDKFSNNNGSIADWYVVVRTTPFVALQTVPDPAPTLDEATLQQFLYTVRLSSPPIGGSLNEVLVRVFRDQVASRIVNIETRPLPGGVFTSNRDLLFNTTNWNVGFEVRVTAVDNLTYYGPFAGRLIMGVVMEDSSNYGVNTLVSCTSPCSSIPSNLGERITGSPIIGGNDPSAPATSKNVVYFSVTENDEPTVAIITTLGTTVNEDGSLTDTYQVVLNSQPATVTGVILTITDGQLVVSSPGHDTLGAYANFGIDNTRVTGNATTIVLRFRGVLPDPTGVMMSVNQGGDWNVPQTVTVTAVNDAVVEGVHVGVIQHTANSYDPYYIHDEFNTINPGLGTPAVPIEIDGIVQPVPGSADLLVTINDDD